VNFVVCGRGIAASVADDYWQRLEMAKMGWREGILEIRGEEAHYQLRRDALGQTRSSRKQFHPPQSIGLREYCAWKSPERRQRGP
jgi:hypothetical protein